MSGIIPKDQSANYRPWQIGSFDQPAAKAPAPAAPEPVLSEIGPEASVDVAPPLDLPSAEDIERIYEEARSSGYQAGHDEGMAAAEEAGRAAAEAEARHFLGLTENLHQALAGLDQSVAEQLLALAIEIAAQVTAGSIKVKHDLLLPIIRDAIAALPLHHTHVTLRLSPTDAIHVKELTGDQLMQNNVQIIEDAEISPGGCMIRAGNSEVDASIETRWKRVLEAIGAEPQAWLNP